MPIDDALAEIKPKKKIVVKADENDLKKYKEVFDVIKTYPSKILGLAKAENMQVFDTSIFESIGRYMKFAEDFEMKIIAIEKESLIDILNRKSQLFKILVGSTDIKSLIPEYFTLNELNSYNALLNCKEIEKILHYQSMQKVQEYSRQLFTISNLSIMSLFIEEGEKLRKYEAINGVPQYYIFEVRNQKVSKWNEYPPFSLQELLNFQQETGICDIKNMIEQVQELKNLLDSYISPTQTIEKIKEIKRILFERLAKYNPILVYEGD